MRFIFPQMHDIRPRTWRGELDVERIRRIKPLLDLRGIPPVQPSLPRSVKVDTQDIDVAESIAMRRSGSLHPRAQATAIRKPTPQIHQAPSDLPISHVDESLAIPTKLGFVFPWSFAISIFLSMLFVPALAFVGSSWQLEAQLRTQVTSAADTLQAATRAMAAFDTDTAEDAFISAAESFSVARADLSDVGFGILDLLAELPFLTKLSSGKAVLEAGEHMAQAGESLSRAMGTLTALQPSQFFAQVLTFRVEETDAWGAQQSGALFETSLLNAAAHLGAALDSLERVDIAAVPEEYRTKMLLLKEAIPTIRAGVSGMHEHARAVAGMLGMRDVRRYLVLLQNTSELRPTGGFVGNIALITVANGRIVELEVDDSYRFDGQIIDYTVPPEPIQDISASWSLHDANWYRDFPTSAKIAAEFFEAQGGATPDGVFAITSSSIERILKVVGPIPLKAGEEMRAENFVDVLNAVGAAQRPGETTQVRLVADMLPRLLDRIAQANEEEREALAEALREAIAALDVQVWLRDPAEQNLVRSSGLAGEVPKDFLGDILGVVHANVNGYKSERVIGEAVTHRASIDRTGEITVTVDIERHHHGDEAALDFYQQVSKSYTRILVPTGSTLLSASGFTCKPEGAIRARDYEALAYTVHSIVEANEATLLDSPGTCVATGEENGVGVFAGWIFVSPGETVKVSLTYRLPRRLTQSTDSYRLLVLKQPGFVSTFENELRIDPIWEAHWVNSEYDGVEPERAWTHASPLTRNRFFGVVLQKGDSQ